MDALAFMAAVLPPPGNGRYCVVELTNKKEHVFVKDIEDTGATLERWRKQNCDIYFALGTFGSENKRVATNSQMVKCIAIDVDCNHPRDLPDEHGVITPKAYPAARVAAQAILDFCQVTGLAGLGEPWMVASGGGVHAYWPLTEAVSIADWKPVAEAFKRLCVLHKLHIDMTVTADASRVLRVPDTVNNGVKGKKRVRERTNVRFMHEGSLFAIEDISALVHKGLVGTNLEVKAAKPPSTLTLPGVRPTASLSAQPIKLYPNSSTKFGNIFKATKRGSGCGQLAHYVENADQDGMEPLWRGMLSIAQKCDDGDRAAAWLSGLHPYSEERMQQKLAEIRGPYPCTKFDSENPGVCTSCKHWGKITNPLTLGREYSTETAVKEIEVVIPHASTDPRKILRPEAPRGYAYGRDGGVFIEKDDEDAEGNKVKRQILLVPYDLFPLDILNNNGEHTIHMLALRPEGTQTVTLPQKSVVSKDDTLKSLAQQNILASFGAGNDKNLFDYIRASVEKMSTEKQPIKVPGNSGWQPDDTFVYGGKIYSTAEPLAVPMLGMENIVNNTQAKGTLDGWKNVINLFIRKKMYDHLGIILFSAGAPLMRFTGIYGLTIHCGSTESGTGKSLALEGAASIWGHPVHYRTGKSTSPVAMQQRLGLLNSMPLITDEITSKNRASPEWFSEFLLDMTEGRGKERMESGSNKERLNLSTWMSMALMSSNTHVVDTLTGARKHAAEGELRRLLEFVLDEELAWEPHEVEIIKSLGQNYGVVGDLFSDYLAKHVPDLITFVPEVVANTYTDFKATNDERFWMAGIGAAMSAGLLLGSAHADIVNFPLPEILEAYKRRVDYMRSNIHTNTRTAEDVLNAYTRENYGHFVVVNFGAAGGVLAQMGDGAVIDKSTTRSHVMGRIENGVTAGYVDYYVDERQMKAFCATMSFGYADFKKQMEKQFAVTYMPKKDLMGRTNGPHMRVAVMKISRRVDEEAALQLSVEES